MHDDDASPSVDDGFVPWPLIGDAFKDAWLTWRYAWLAILVYAALQSAGIAFAYQLIVRALPSTVHGTLTLACIGAFASVVLGGVVGAPLARYVTLSINETPLLGRDYNIQRHYRNALPVLRSTLAVIAALLMGMLAVAFILLTAGAVLCTVGGIIGRVIVAIAGFIILPLIGVLFFPLAHALWAAACLNPNDPRGVLLQTKAAFSPRSARGDAFIWGAAMMVLSVASLSILLVVFSAAALFGNVVVTTLLGVFLLAVFMSVQWALAMRFHAVLVNFRMV